MIRETVVVEGKDDIRAVKNAVDCQVIATGGIRFGRAKMAEIREAARRTGIIVLTDPDYAGGRIRARITDAVPDAKHAWLPRKDAQQKGRAGVEHATPEAIRKALEAVRTEAEEAGIVSMADLFALGLSGTRESAALRRAAGRVLGIGDCNAARFLERVNRYGITPEEIRAALRSDHGR